MSSEAKPYIDREEWEAAERDARIRLEIERDELRAQRDAAVDALCNLLDRIRSEPAMSGHLRNMHLKPDSGDSHGTSDAIRAAKVALLRAKGERK